MAQAALDLFGYVVPAYDDLKTEESNERTTIMFGPEANEKVNEQYLFLDNSFICPFVVEGVEYKSVLHYYHASKFTQDFNEEVRAQILTSEDVSTAKQISTKAEELDQADSKNECQWKYWET